MTTTTFALVLLALALAVAITAAGAHFALAGVRGRRRAAWELDRAEWRRWMSRP